MRPCFPRGGRPAVGILALAAVASFLGSRPCNAVSCDAKPEDVREAIRKYFPSWHVVEITDLHEDHRTLWTKQNGDNCPGLVTGHFDSHARASHIVLLSRRKGPKLLETVIQVSRGPAEPQIRTLSKPTETVSGSVLVTVPPGEYEDIEGDQKVRVSFDAVVYGRLEAGGILFYWTGRRFGRLVVSE
jgi:hypothetical protein